MVLYLDKLESLIEKWQSKWKTIEISQLRPASSEGKASGVDSEPDKARRRRVQEVALVESNPNKPVDQNKENLGGKSSSNETEGNANCSQAAKTETSKIISVTVTIPPAAAATKTQPSSSNEVRETRRPALAVRAAIRPTALLERRRASPRRLPSGLFSCARYKVRPSLLLYALLALAWSPIQVKVPKSSSQSSNTAGFHFALVSATMAAEAGANTIAAAISPASQTASHGSLFEGAGLGLASQGLALANSIRNRWPSSGSNSGFGLRRPIIIGAGDDNRHRRSPFAQFARAVDRIRSKIGARNSIRVHNAFRDFVWKVLDSFSMPTPVIYELRRQNIYPQDDNLKNDSMFNKNTTQTVRSKRWADVSKTGETTERIQRRRGDDDEDDDERNSFRDRLRYRLDELLSLSRRNLFGRVVRLPSLFPFKRQEDEVDEQDEQPTKRRRLRRRQKEPERQMISINGKQYYVDDNRELKEVAKEKSAS